MNELEELRNKIILIAKKKGKTQNEIIKNCNLNHSFMQYMKVREPGIIKIKEIANYLDISIDYLLGRTDNPEAHK